MLHNKNCGILLKVNKITTEMHFSKLFCYCQSRKFYS